jgi:hypothetical protein
MCRMETVPTSFSVWSYAHQLVANAIRLPEVPKYIAEGHRILAEIPITRGELSLAQTELTVALELLERTYIPLTAWRWWSLNQSILEQHGFDASTYHSVLVISTLFGLVAKFADRGLASYLPISMANGHRNGSPRPCAPGPSSGANLHSCCPVCHCNGVSGGVVTVVFFSVWGQAFGRSHLGRIQACAVAEIPVPHAYRTTTGFKRAP